MGKLVLVRHGESRWNLDNRFTGWTDVPLSKGGINEAEECAAELKRINFDIAFTSILERTQATILIILSQQNRTGVFQHEGKSKYSDWKSKSNRYSKNDIPIFSSELLNERYYGTLQGMKKNEAVKIYGKEQIFRWRRSYEGAPPEGESLRGTYERTLPFYKEKVLPHLQKGKQVLLASHGNTLRAIIKDLEGISDEDIPFLNLPHSKAIIYKFTNGEYKNLTPDVYSFDRPLR